MPVPLELLSPARNLEYGKAAITHGADAVYIGAPRFSARAEAHNTIADIEQLVRFAHLYRAKVYAALNTILYDSEIIPAVQMIRQLYEAGVDALIIQDMGLLQCDLPPVPLFASTQMHNHTVEKVSFLEKVGFSRVILARELCLTQIETIRRQTNIELECFIHGALCVSYSGQCYMSQAIAGRSGNRGVCAQPCRSLYDLLDANGRTIVEKAYLLSLKDLNLSEYLAALADAGVTSFKIEGRLKDLNYVKNITAFYRHSLDAIIENNRQFVKASSGNIYLRFVPDPYKTFNRGYTCYFINGRKTKVASPQTQKSIGKRLGIVTQVKTGYARSLQQWFTIDTKATVSNGDGLCWLNPVTKRLEGALVNKVEGDKIFPAKPVQLKSGTEIFRNSDFIFENTLSGNSADRRIVISLELSEHESGYTLRVEDEDRNIAEHSVCVHKLPAKDAETARKYIHTQLCKLGNSMFLACKVIIPATFNYFIPTATLNEMRRLTIRLLEDVRAECYVVKSHERIVAETNFHVNKLDYSSNISNQYAKKNYKKYGVQHIDDAFELQGDCHGKVLMIAKHCIKYQYNMCPCIQRSSLKWKEPLLLRDKYHTYRLEFDCRACEMKVVSH